ncbi:BTAD domain-containing putative transcriptional regulator [Kitasatospora sp. NPDC058201]|uniref:AfsR/SARP family transcriptional regulator n=1 Tax=unclassified Kitasatospora TaxID=2633591 RepID=UPI003660F1D6
MTVEFGVLGTIEARVAGRPADVGHLRQRCVLAALLVDANRAVPADELVERVWAGRAPQRAMGTLYSYLSRLRRALDGAGTEVRIGRQAGGYVLEVEPGAVDLHRFRLLAARARASDGEQAAELMRQALELWRGEAFATVDTPWFHELRRSLEQERFSAELDGTDLSLRNGLHGEVLPALTARTAQHPLDERLAGQLMLALCRSGRSADALAHYRRLRRRLAEELGADPGPALMRLHRQVLTDDPGLAAPRPAPRPGPPAVPVPRQLPACPSWLTGRDRQLAELDGALSAPHPPGDAVAVCAVGGSGGIGKTWLALHWAHRNLDRFPDGQLYADLRGFDPSGERLAPTVAVRAFLDALGVSSDAVPAAAQAQARLYRSLVQGRRMLIVLDNAADAEQAAALLPGSATCAVLVTSRRRLAGLASAHGARLLTLDVLAPPDARALMLRHLGPARAEAEPAAVTALLEHCAGLPLAISVVGARAAAHPGFPLAVLAEELRDESARLDALDAGDLTADVRAAFTVSYRALGAGAAEVFRLIGLAPGPEIGTAAVAALTAWPAGAVRTALRELENAHLVRQPAPGRYRLHDLVRLHAAERARQEPDGNDRALLRLMDFYVHTAGFAAERLDPHRDRVSPAPAGPGVTPEEPADHGAALTWFTAEHAVLLGAIDRAVSAGLDAHAWHLAWALETFFDFRGHWHDWAATQRTALEAARRLGDPARQAGAHRSLGSVHTQMGRPDEGHGHFRHALDLYRLLDDRTGQAHTHRGLGWVLVQQDRQREALGHVEQALALYRQTGHAGGQARALNNVGWLNIMLGDHRTALDHCVQAVRLNREIGDRHGEAGAWDSLGHVHHHLGDHAQAVDCYRRALELDRGFGDRYGETEILGHLGDTHLATGDPDAARQTWRQALTIAEEIGHPSTDELRGKLAGLPAAQP